MIYEELWIGKLIGELIMWSIRSKVVVFFLSLI